MINKIVLAVLCLASSAFGQAVGGGGVPGAGGSATLPTAAGIGYPLKSTAAGTTYAALSPIGLDPRDYGADFNGASVADATTTSGSNVVTCANSDCNFPSNIAGYIIFATAGNGTQCLDNASITFGGNLQTTVAGFTNANSITVTGNSNTTSTAHACLAWFPKDSTSALAAWWTAGGCRGSYVIPPGLTLFSSPIMQNIPGCPSSFNQGNAYPGQTVKGAGVGTSYLIPAPVFTYTSIIGTTTTNCAVGNLDIEHEENFAVYGLGERATTSLNACLFMVGQATSAFRIDAVGWNARGGGTLLVGVQMIGATDTFNVGGINFFGTIMLNMNAGVQMLVENNYFTGNPSTLLTTCGIHITNGATVKSTNNGYQGGCIQVDANSVLHSENDSFDASDAVCVYANGGGIYFQGSLVNAANTCTTGLQFLVNTSTVTSQNTGIKTLTGISGATFDDWGGTTLSGTTTLNSMTYNKVSLVSGP